MQKPRPTDIHWFIDTFESLVDLFTLLSFALIIASLIYGTQSFRSNAEQVEVATVAPGASESIEMPENVIVLMLKYAEPEIKLYIIKPGHQPESHSVSISNINKILASEVTNWDENTEVNVAIERSNELKLSRIHILIIDLFNQMGIKKHFHYFY